MTSGCPGWNNCYYVTNIVKRDHFPPLPGNVFECQQPYFAPVFTLDCTWKRPELADCSTGSHKLQTLKDACRECRTLCWRVYSATYAITDSAGIIPEKGTCDSAPDTPNEAPITHDEGTKTKNDEANSTSQLNPDSRTAPSKDMNLPKSTADQDVSVSDFANTTTLDISRSKQTDSTGLTNISSTASPEEISQTTSEPSAALPRAVSTKNVMGVLLPAAAPGMDALDRTGSTPAVSSPPNGVSAPTGQGQAGTRYGGDNPGLAIGVGVTVPILVTLGITFSLILYRRQRHRRDKEKAEKTSIPCIEPDAISGDDNDAHTNGNGNLSYSYARKVSDFLRDEDEHRNYDVRGNSYIDIADGDIAFPELSDQIKNVPADDDLAKDENLSNPQDNDKGAVYVRANEVTMEDNTYSKLSNGMGATNIIFPENVPETYNMAAAEEFEMTHMEENKKASHVYNRLRGGVGVSEGGVRESVPETYNMASTQKFGMAQGEERVDKGDIYNRLRDGATVSREITQGGYLETYNVASTEEFGSEQREGGEERGHVYNRLRDGAGIPRDAVRRKDLETYNVAAGQFEPRSENPHGKQPCAVLGNPYSFASTIDSDPGSSSLAVKECGGRCMEDLTITGQGQTPCGNRPFGFTAIADCDHTNSEYFVLEHDKDMDTRETSHGESADLGRSLEQSTEYFLLEDDTEKGCTRDISDTLFRGHTKTEYSVLEEDDSNVNGDVDNLPRYGEENPYALTETKQEETEYSLAEDDLIKYGGDATHQGQTMDGLVSPVFAGDGYGQEGHYFMLDGDVAKGNVVPIIGGDNNEGRREDGGRKNRNPELDIVMSHVYNELTSDEDKTEYMDINEILY